MILRIILTSLDDVDLEPAQGSFSAEEVKRAEAIASPERRRRFLARRWMARSLLAAETGEGPTELVLERRCERCGDLHPASPLAGATGEGVWWSASSSGQTAAVAIAPFRIGLDLERRHELSERRRQHPERSAERSERLERPEHGGDRPEHSAEQLERSPEQPEPSAEQPEHSAELPEHGALQPEHGALQPERSPELPEHSADRPEHSAELPGHGALQPEHRALQPERSPVLHQQTRAARWERIADRHFTAAEAAEAAASPVRFLELWTLKEAYLKALGLGLPGGLHSLDCAALAPAEDGWASSDAHPGWRFRNLDLDPDLVAALAVEGLPTAVEIGSWRGAGVPA